MPRFRALAAVVVCLAVLAGALNMAAAAQAPGAALTQNGMVTAPCSHCEDFDKTPCPMPMADCIQVHPNAAPALVSAAVEVPASAYVTIRWAAPHTSLSGLSPPPDPFPPRT